MKVLALAAVLAASTSLTDDSTGSIKEIEKQRTTPTVTSVKPVLTEPHVIAISGVVKNGVRGGWNYEAEYELFEAEAGDGAVTITLEVWSPKNAVASKNVEKFSTKVEIPDLRDRTGRFDLIVKSVDGKELGRGIFEVGALPTARTSN